MGNLRAKIRSLIFSSFGRTSMGQNGIRNIAKGSTSVAGEVFQVLKAEGLTIVTADYVNVSGEDSDTSVSKTLQDGDELPGAWHNVAVTEGAILAYF